jgi:hypothetical protein
MTAGEFIVESIDAGQRNGVAALDERRRWIYLIAEAECLCEMEGIDSFFETYAPAWIRETADAFEAVGASEIAAEFRLALVDAPTGDPRMNRLNELIRRRAGYDYDAIRRVLEARIRE